jgi:ankyrin repeat protein
MGMNIKDKDIFLKKLSQALKEAGPSPSFESLKGLVQEQKLDIDDRLFIAILLSEPEVVEHLLEVGADANATNKQGTTLLQLALAFGREDIAELLVQNGAMPSFETRKKFKF